MKDRTVRLGRQGSRGIAMPKPRQYGRFNRWRPKKISFRNRKIL
jgi:hypothetical protein